MEIAFKLPGTQAMVFADDVTRSVEIDDWIARVLASHNWTGWYCYNDSFSKNCGKCKGIVLWNSTRAAWLVHSIPAWPAELPTERLPACEEPYGHSFAFWVGAKDRLSKIESQVDLMGAKVYIGRRSVLCGVSNVPTLQRIILDKRTDHLAKNKLWGRDIYEAIGRCLVRSNRGSFDDTAAVENVRCMQIPGWNDEFDRGTWAVGETWVCVGDVSRSSTHLDKGGGCIIYYNADVARAVKRLVC